MASLGSQLGAVTLNNLRSIPQRAGISAVIVIGIAVTVAVLVSVLAMAAGFGRTLSNTGREDRAMVLRGGSQSELASTLSRDNALTVQDAKGLRRDADGKPIASAEMVAIVSLKQKNTGTKANVTLRGVGPKAFVLRPEIRIVAGRNFRPAVRELIVGKSALAQFEGLELGRHLTFHDGEWTVVGVFDSNGDSHESELMADSETVLSAYRRNLFQSVTLMLESRQAFDAFKDQLTTDPTLSVDVKRETDYFAEQSRQLSRLLFFVAYIVGGIMAVGAVFGALNTMYSAVASRSLEIATLRAIGFGALPVVFSVLVESLLLALLGGVLGAALAWTFFNGNSVNTLGSNFTQVVFQLTVTPSLALSGIVLASVVGLLGGLFLGDLDAAARRVPRDHAGAGLRRRGDGAVPVRRDDARHQHRRLPRGLLEALSARRDGGRGDRARDVDGADRRLPRQRRARGRPAPGAAGQYAAARHRDVHELPLPAADRRGAAAGGHHRRHRTHAAPAQGLALRRPGAAGACTRRRPRARDQAAAGGRRALGTRHQGRGGRLMGPLTLGHYLSLGGVLFALSVVGIFLNRRNLIVLLMAIELMLLAVNLNFVAFSHYLGDMAGQVFVFFILTVAAAESAIGLAILVVLFRGRASINVEELDDLKG